MSQGTHLAACRWNGTTGGRILALAIAPSGSLLKRRLQRFRKEPISQVENMVYGTIEETNAKMEVILQDIVADPERIRRLACWQWIADSLQAAR